MPYNAGRKLGRQPDDETELLGRVGPSGHASPTAGMLGTAQPTTGGSGGSGSQSENFVSFGRWLGLNKAGADAQAARLTGDTQKQGDANQRNAAVASNNFATGVAAGTNRFQTPNVLPPKPAAVTPEPVAVSKGPGLEATPTRSAPAPKPQQPPPPTPMTAGGLLPAQSSVMAPTSQMTLGPTPSTREQVAAQARQEYTGPTSLSESNPGWAGIMEAARRNSNAAIGNTTQEGRQAELAKVYGGDAAQMGAPTSYNSRLDAAMAGVAGGDAFDQQKERFGGQAADFEAKDARSKEMADRAAVDSHNAGGQYAAWLRNNPVKAPEGPKEKAPIIIGAAPGVGSTSSTIGATQNSIANAHTGIGPNGQGYADQRQMYIGQFANSGDIEASDAIASMTDAEFADWINEQMNTSHGDGTTSTLGNKIVGADEWLKKHRGGS